MNAREILDGIANKEGAAFFKVHLPSMGKDLMIKHLSVNDQKVISKLAIDDDDGVFASESDLAKISLAETNAVEPFQLEHIDIRDYFILCCAIRKENYMDSFAVNFQCDKCREKFDGDIDFGVLIENATEYEPKFEKTIISTRSLGEIRLTLGLPKQMDLIMMEMYYDRVSKVREVKNAEKYIDYVICCVSDVEVKDESGTWKPVDDFNDGHYLDKVEFIQGVKADIEQLSKLFNTIGLLTSEFFYDVECPNCKNKVPSFVSTSDFFTL